MGIDELKEILSIHSAVALYFSTPGCGVCHALKPKVEQMFEQVFPQVRFVHVELDKSPGIAGEYSIFSAPTLLVFFEGKEFLRKSRNMGIQELQQTIERPYRLLFQ